MRGIQKSSNHFVLFAFTTYAVEWSYSAATNPERGVVLAIAAVRADARLLVLLGLDLVGQSNWCKAQQLEGAVEILDHSDLQMMGRQTEGEGSVEHEGWEKNTH